MITKVALAAKFAGCVVDEGSIKIYKIFIFISQALAEKTSI
jgi:hypothetical protein